MLKKISNGNFTVNVNFNLRQTTPANELTAINAIIRFNNKRLVISGIDKIEPRYFKDGKPKQHAANARARQISKNLSNASAIITDTFEKYTSTYNQYPEDIKAFQNHCKRLIFNIPEAIDSKQDEKKSTDIIKYLENFRDGIKNGKRVISSGRKKGQPYGSNTHKQFGSLIVNLKAYTTANNIATLNFNDIDLDFYTSFREYLVVKNSKNPSYFGTMIKCLKSAMNDAAEFGYHNNIKYKSRHFIKEAPSSDNVFLDNEKLNILFNLDLSDNHRLDYVRDLFLIGSYTGLRFSDFSTLKPENINGDYIRVKTQKTGSLVTIPITPNLSIILKKYNGRPLRSISNQKFNEYIKELCKKADFNELVSVKKYLGGKECHTNEPFWKMVSSHNARRSFATNMFKAGIPSILIMAITGHASEKAFLVYIRMNNDDKAVMMMDILRRSELRAVSGGAA